MSVRGPRKNNPDWEATSSGGYRKKAIAASALDTRYDTLRESTPYDSLEDHEDLGYDSAIEDIESEFGDVADLDDFGGYDDYDDYNPKDELAELGLDLGHGDSGWD